MLESLHLRNVGPAPEMSLALAPRLNLITGDNGLGKTLLLDAAWWALARTWPITWGGRGIVPDQEGATITWVEQRDDGAIRLESAYEFNSATWRTILKTQVDAYGNGLLVYLRVDGGVSIHDPLRTGEDFRLPFGQSAWGNSHSFQFLERQIWDGLRHDDGAPLVCEGLVRDLVRWAVEPGNPEFDQLAKLVELLAGEEPFELTSKVQRVYLADPRDFPVVVGPAGELPVAHAPAGLRRILGLAYLVVWAWREHRIAASLKKLPPATSLVLLVDEVESHLHPKWQRTILPSLVRALSDDVQLQVIATTHSPMVLASVEPIFDTEQDAWFDLDMERKGVVLRRRPFVRHGEVGNWLVSDAFDLKEPRSLESEQAITAAQAVLDSRAPSTKAIEAADRRLRSAGLPDIDPFWVQWGYFREQHAKKRKKPPAKNGRRPEPKA